MFLLALVLLDLKIIWFIFFHPKIVENLCVLMVVLKIFLVVVVVFFFFIDLDFIERFC